MNDTRLPSDDPKLTAYALGELNGDERAAVEAALRENPALRLIVEEIRATAAALEAAFARTFAHPKFRAEAEKSQLEISPLYGESIRQIVGEFLTMPPMIKERLKRSLKR